MFENKKKKTVPLRPAGFPYVGFLFFSRFSIFFLLLILFLASRFLRASFHRLVAPVARGGGSSAFCFPVSSFLTRPVNSHVAENKRQVELSPV